MIKLIYGSKGTGKTKRIIDEANDSVAETNGNQIFIADTTRYMFDVKREVRFVNTKEYEIKTMLGLLGFVRGLIAGDADIKRIFIDGATRMCGLEIEEMGEFYEKLEHVSNATGVDFVLTVSADELPEFLKKFI